MKKKELANTGITLIALVVTIIVLLILAGISIAMLSGNNGILKQVTEARTNTERESIIEQAKIDVLAYQTDNQSGKIGKDQLKNVLDTYFKDVPTEEDLPDGEDLLNLELTTLDRFGTYTIKVFEIYNGDILGGLDSTGNIRITDFLIAGTTVTDVPLPSSDYEKVVGTEIGNSYVARGKTGTEYEGDEFVWVPVDKNQQFIIKIEGSGDITSVILTNPVGDTKILVNNVKAPKSITGISPIIEEKIYNGEYKITVIPEVGEPIEKKIDVHSLYAFDVGLYLECFKAINGENYEEIIQTYYGGIKGLISGLWESEENYASSVEQNGGFWIGRYEASYKDGKPASVVSTATRGGSRFSPDPLTNGMLWWIPRNRCIKCGKKL